SGVRPRQPGGYMDEVIVSQRWWVVLIVGLLLLFFGGLLLFEPAFVLAIIIDVFGIFLIVDGILVVVRATSIPLRTLHSLLLLIAGLLIILFGISAFTLPSLIATVVAYLIALWAFVNGFFRLYLAYLEAGQVGRRVLMILSGGVMLGLGTVLVAYPLPVVIALLQIVGAFIIVTGILDVILAFIIWRASPPRVQEPAV
ncbi:MAG TPA: DUF308 domain-containing protein, partial [Methanomicrobiales archaeon]|nr:DUF308 domain-containing protein [Methanomicrobiales archaeon]